MLKVFELQYTPPDSMTFSLHYMPQLYDKYKQKVVQQTTEGLQWYAVASNGWSFRANHSHISVTLHYINND